VLGAQREGSGGPPHDGLQVEVPVRGLQGEDAFAGEVPQVRAEGLDRQEVGRDRRC
jgi:hypothetical protein